MKRIRGEQKRRVEFGPCGIYGKGMYICQTYTYIYMYMYCPVTVLYGLFSIDSHDEFGFIGNINNMIQNQFMVESISVNCRIRSNRQPEKQTNYCYRRLGNHGNWHVCIFQIEGCMCICFVFAPTDIYLLYDV